YALLPANPAQPLPPSIHSAFNDSFFKHDLTPNSCPEKSGAVHNERGASYPAIPDNAVKKFRFPIPPLEIQREIVKVLDTFTKLEAELEARRRQYQYYRRRAPQLRIPLLWRGARRAGWFVGGRNTTPSGFACHPSNGGEYRGTKHKVGHLVIVCIDVVGHIKFALGDTNALALAISQAALFGAGGIG
nr:restriction endonuclease subunit S [Sterolibacterium sp.]